MDTSMGTQSGGGGYILTIKSLEEMAKDGALTQDVIRALTIENPARILAY